VVLDVLVVSLNDNDCWFDSLVNVARPVRRGENNCAGVAFLRKAVDAVVVVLVVHPEVELVDQVRLGVPLLNRQLLHFYWRVVQTHVQTQPHHCSEELLEVRREQVVLHQFLCLFLPLLGSKLHVLHPGQVNVADDIINLGVLKVEDGHGVFLQNDIHPGLQACLGFWFVDVESACDLLHHLVFLVVDLLRRDEEDLLH